MVDDDRVPSWWRCRSTSCSARFVLRSGIAERMYNALVQWLSWLPGGLMHSNVAACSMFAAVSGSSVATAVTIGTVALDEVKKYKYNERLFLGTLAAGGTLGILIPPSINLIVYGVMTETFDSPTLPCGIHSRVHAGGPLPPHGAACLLVAAALGWRAGQDKLVRADARPAGPHPAAHDLRDRDRLDLCRPGHRHRIGRPWHSGGPGAGGLEAAIDVDDAETGARRHDAHDRRRHADHSRRLFPQCRDQRDRPDRRRRQFHHRAEA